MRTVPVVPSMSKIACPGMEAWRARVSLLRLALLAAR